jgi:GT2 family glycosyltransferase
VSGAAALSVGIVVYRSALTLLGRTLDALDRAIAAMSGERPNGCEVVLIDNGPPDYSVELAAWLEARGGHRPTVLTGHGNIGYGRGNNLAIVRTGARHHLVLNPDAELDPDALELALDHLERHPEVGLIAASSVDAAGRALNLCKTYPSVAILASRTLPDALVRGPLRTLRSRYDLRPAAGGSTDVTGALVSGSFMLFRTSALRAVGGFDPRYFLYFEDFDLSFRLARVARVVWLPQVRILHHGGKAASKGWAHRRMFVRGAARFFSTHGWRLW